MRYLMAVFVWLAALSLDSLYCMQVNEAPLSIEVKTGGPTVSELREQYRTLDQQCLELAKRLRSNPTPANRQSLTEMVERAFRVRQDLQRAEVAESARRLQKIQQTIDSREGLKSQIVQRRVDELLDPNVDWLKSDLIENTRTQAEQKAERVEAVSQPSDASISAVQTDRGSAAAPNASSRVESSELLRRSPTEMRDFLEFEGGLVRRSAKECAGYRASIQKEGDSKQLRDKLKMEEASLADRQRRFQFARLQYEETIKYLEVALDSLKEQLEIAEQEHQVKTALFQRGSVTQLEVNASLARPRELQVELQRVESLLKLYRAAGDIPEMAEPRSSSTLGFNIHNTKLGVPTWIEGGGGLTTSTNGFSIVAHDRVGLAAQILFSKLPGHDDARLMLKVDTPNSISDAMKQHGSLENDWHSVSELAISDAAIQAAIDGKPFRKSYFLKPDGSMNEKDTGSEAANSEKDPLVATIELAVP